MAMDGRNSGRRGRRLSVLFIGVAAVLLTLLGTTTPGAATDVCGPILSDTTWTAAGSPYVATCSVLVMSGATLTIEPSVVVQFNADLGLQVDGQLIARGTAAHPITFTKNGDANWGYIWLTDSSVDAQFDAGGAYVSGSIIEYATIEYAGSTSAESQSGALLLKNAFPFVHATTIRNNVASGVTAWGLTSAKPLRISSNTITGNTNAMTGGGINITVVSGSEVLLTNNTVTGNTARQSGGGINVTGGTLTLTNNTVTGNTTVGYSPSFCTSAGGGIYIMASAATLANNTVTGNTAAGCGTGGGIYAKGGTPVLNSNIINGNSATGYGFGGGIYAYGATVVVNGNIITGNAATGTYARGGGVYIEQLSTTTAQLINNTITKNRAAKLGGGAYTYNPQSGAVDFHTNSFIGNTAPNGSASYYSGNNNLNLNSNLVVRNVATTEGTGATLFLAAGYPVINLNNIYANTSAYELWNDNPQGSDTVNAESNWWGTTSSGEIMGKIYDYFDNSGKSIVDFSPFLTESNPAAPIPPIDKVGVFRPADGTFYLDYNGSGTWEGCAVDRCLQIGMAGDVALVGDWNGTGSSKVGLFRPSDGTFYLDYNGNGQWDGCGTDRCLQIGMNGDIPLVGDWNGTGTSKVGAFRPSDGTFYLDYNGNGAWDGCGVDRCLQIGMLGDIPLVGDWNGSGTSKVGAFRPTDGTFYLDYNGNGVWDGCGTDRCLAIGLNGDIPLVGDWNGTSSSKVGVFRPSNGTFYLDSNGSGTWEGCGTDRCLQIGMAGDVPLVGDWNGTGTAKVGAFRPTDGTFYLDHNGNGAWDGCGTDRCLQIGLSGDTPLVGKW